MYFCKFENEVVVVVFDFCVVDENDFDVRWGEVVIVFNRDDVDWWWVLWFDGKEGFILSFYVLIEVVCLLVGKFNLFYIN